MCVNPAEFALKEARQIFGDHRDIGCFISCGLGHTVSGSAWAPTNSIQPVVGNARVRSRLKYIRATEASLHETHLKLESELKGAYFRFDVKELAQISYTEEFTKAWSSILDAQDWRLLQLLGDLSKKYMGIPAQVEKVAKCSAHLRAKRITRTNLHSMNPDDAVLGRTWSSVSSGNQSSIQRSGWQ